MLRNLFFILPYRILSSSNVLIAFFEDILLKALRLVTKGFEKKGKLLPLLLKLLWFSYSVLIDFPIGNLGKFGPGLTAVALALIVMAVCCLLNIQITPSTGVHVIGPGYHIRKQVIDRFGDTVQHPVDERHGLGAGDVPVRLEGSVAVAVDPAVCRSRVLWKK